MEKMFLLKIGDNYIPVKKVEEVREDSVIADGLSYPNVEAIILGALIVYNIGENKFSNGDKCFKATSKGEKFVVDITDGGKRAVRVKEIKPPRRLK